MGTSHACGALRGVFLPQFQQPCRGRRANLSVREEVHWSVEGHCLVSHPSALVGACSDRTTALWRLLQRRAHHAVAVPALAPGAAPLRRHPGGAQQELLQCRRGGTGQGRSLARRLARRAADGRRGVAGARRCVLRGCFRRVRSGAALGCVSFAFEGISEPFQPHQLHRCSGQGQPVAARLVVACLGGRSESETQRCGSQRSAGRLRHRCHVGPSLGAPGTDAAGPAPNAISLNTALRGLSHVSQWTLALATFELFKEQGLKPSNISYTSLMTALANAELWQQALQQLKSHAAPDVVAFNAALTAASRSTLPAVALSLLKELKLCGLQPQVTSYNIALSCQPWAEALRLLDEMPFPGDHVTYRVALEVLAQAPLELALSFHRDSVDAGLALGPRQVTDLHGLSLEAARVQVCADLLHAALQGAVDRSYIVGLGRGSDSGEAVLGPELLSFLRALQLEVRETSGRLHVNGRQLQQWANACVDCSWTRFAKRKTDTADLRYRDTVSKVYLRNFWTHVNELIVSDRSMRRLRALGLGLALWLGLTGLSDPAAVATAAAGDELLIYGAGYLGRRVAKLWQQQRPGAKVTCATRTAASHPQLAAEGWEALTTDELSGGTRRFAQVVFCAPPSRSDDYGAAVRAAMGLLEEHGAAVFTSSAGVFAEDSGGTVDESGAVGDSPANQRMLSAEKAAEGAAVLRLAGLYDLDRGPHAYWLKTGVVTGQPDGLINLVHYDDAASAVVQALQAKSREVFVVADGVPLSRRGICEAAAKAKHFGAAMPSFKAGEWEMGGTGGKRLDASKARRVLGWRPQFPSFAEYMAAH
ncbi:unnamed protein product [Effrenium voratum]|uniref:NAD(P)-binding domain-containing protein n=1 Tax=Effrenium voratum TaxID=2562239 RepID=A0AA36IYD8_9DINO|nr:unnamed protein product [Effrenium voratum]